MKLLVFGANGLLGTVLCSKLKSSGHDVFGFFRSPERPCHTETEIESAFSRAFENHQPDCVINLIAATNVDQCQQDMSHAALINCFVPQVLSNLCRTGTHLVHISSDQVYSGTGPHLELGSKPINVYGLTKLTGEYPVLLSGGCVLRTNFFGKSQTSSRASFSDWLVNSGRKSQPINVFEDVFFSPLGFSSLSSAIMRAIDMRLSGLYNVGACNGVSKATFARLLFDQLGLEKGLLISASIENANLGATRPKDMRMDINRFEKVTGFMCPTVEGEIKDEATKYV